MLALPSRALAEASVGLIYEAPEGCPARPDFVAAVAARGGDFAKSASAGSRRVMAVAIRRDDRGFAGAFQVRDAETATNKREVHGQSCGEVVEALAVVTAIALRSDADADTAPVAEVTPPAPPPAAPPPVAPPSQDKAGAKPPAPRRLRGHTQYFPPRAQEVEVGAGTLRFDRQQSYAVSGGAVVGLVPSLAIPRYDLSVVTANFVTAPDGAQRIDGVIGKIRLSLLGQGTYRSSDTSTTLLGASFGMGLCGSPFYDTGGLVLLFCGEYGGGFMNLVTKGTDGSQIQTKNVGFGEIALEGEIKYNFGSYFFIEATVGGGGILGAFTAERADGSAIFGSPSALWHWSAYGLVGIGLHF
jgi:hypothetical protein